MHGHKAGGKGSAMSCLDYKALVRAGSRRRPSLLSCLCGWGTACVSVEASPEIFQGPGGCLQQHYAVALGHGALFPLHKMPPNQKGNAVQVKQISRNHPALI